MNDAPKKKAMSLPDRAWGLRHIIQKWNQPIQGCGAAAVWITEEEIEFLKDTVKVLDAFAFYAADDFVRREAEKKRKGKAR
ncbi:hypothetical protein ACFSYD_13585 [Paracoccus aerius]|nr:hypothetical protein GCM10017322_22940 [Paracoccus aerius]